MKKDTTHSPFTSMFWGISNSLRSPNRFILNVFLLALILNFRSISIAQIQLGSDLTGEQETELFGFSVAMSSDGQFMVVGAKSYNINSMLAAGRVQTFSWDGDDWQIAGASLEGSQASELFGYAVALSDDGQILAVGAPGHTNSYGFGAGKVQVYSRNGNEWTPMGEALEGDDDNIFFGMSLDISADGMTLIVGIPFYSPSFLPAAGQARIYQWDGNTWQETAVLSGEHPNERWGDAVSISSTGHTVAIGISENGEMAAYAGKVKVYALDGGNWVQQGDAIWGTVQLSYLGNTVSLSQDGQTLAIGAFRNNENGTDAGQVQVFQWTGSSWEAKGSFLQGVPNSRFGSRVCLSSDGDVLFVGAPYFGNSGSPVGRLYIFRWNGNQWNAQQTDIPGLSSGDRCGKAIAISEDATIVAVSSPYASNSGGSDAGNVRVFEICEPTSSSISVTSCQFYITPSGNALYTESGIYEDNIPNAEGCGDSIITINLTIIPVETAVSWEPPQLIAAANSADYQWVDCENNYAAIPGQTQQVFVPAENGSYAVIISQNGCIDTSACTQIILSNISDLQESLPLLLFPNPVLETEPLHLHIDHKYRRLQLTLYNALGQMIKEETFSGKQEITLKHGLSRGVYYLYCETDDSRRFSTILIIK